MTKVKIKPPKMYHDRIMVASRCCLGLEEDDKAMDDQIMLRQPQSLVRDYAQWHLGDRDWADSFIDLVDKAYGLQITGTGFKVVRDGVLILEAEFEPNK